MNNCTIYQVTDPDNIPADLCFKTVVWKLQKKYGTLTYNYMKALQYGTICKGQYENLLSFKKLLLLLNRYDIRDIPNDTMMYNVIPYSSIKKVITILNNKY